MAASPFYLQREKWGKYNKATCFLVFLVPAVVMPPGIRSIEGQSGCVESRPAVPAQARERAGTRPPCSARRGSPRRAAHQMAPPCPGADSAPLAVCPGRVPPPLATPLRPPDRWWRETCCARKAASFTGGEAFLSPPCALSIPVHTQRGIHECSQG